MNDRKDGCCASAKGCPRLSDGGVEQQQRSWISIILEAVARGTVVDCPALDDALRRYTESLREAFEGGSVKVHDWRTGLRRALGDMADVTTCPYAKARFALQGLLEGEASSSQVPKFFDGWFPRLREGVAPDEELRRVRLAAHVCVAELRHRQEQRGPESRDQDFFIGLLAILPALDHADIRRLYRQTFADTFESAEATQAATSLSYIKKGHADPDWRRVYLDEWIALQIVALQAEDPAATRTAERQREEIESSLREIRAARADARKCAARLRRRVDTSVHLAGKAEPGEAARHRHWRVARAAFAELSQLAKKLGATHHHATRAGEFNEIDNPGSDVLKRCSRLAGQLAASIAAIDREAEFAASSVEKVPPEGEARDG